MKTDPVTPELAVARLFAPEGPNADSFTLSFLEKVPIATIGKIVQQMAAGLGAFREVRKAGTSFETVFERGKVPTEVTLDEEGRIAGLFFRPPVMDAASLADTVSAISKLPGRVSLLVSSDGVERVAVAADKALAVGSAFKLVVLGALVDQIAAKKRAWTDVVGLRDAWKSLPSGFLQSWPKDTPLTLGTLAALMISQSDNTATDALVDVVGRAAVERASPANRPFLTTREVFVLKAPGNEALLASFRAGDEAARRKVLAEAATRPLPAVSAFGDKPRALDVEWFMSARELCQVMAKVGDLPLMSINPGVASASDWERVAYKGGSEPGVVNLTTVVQAKGKRHCVVATWNDEAGSVEETRFFGLYGQLLSALRAEG